jgi:predicted AAA+ superfamily ATPase
LGILIDDPENRQVQFTRLCAGRIGQLLNDTSLASDTGISPNTAKTWLSILESSYILHRLQPYHRNFSKRLVKSPKLYFYDTGVVCSLRRSRLRGLRRGSSMQTSAGVFISWRHLECISD